MYELIRTVEAPNYDLVSVQEVQANLRVTFDDALIAQRIRSASRVVEEYLGRSLLTQTWQLSSDSLNHICHKDNMARLFFNLPRPPMQEMGGIYAMTFDGTETALDPLTYFVGTKDPAVLVLRPGWIWPVNWSHLLYQVRFTAGYGDTADSVPEPIKEAIIRMVTSHYSMRSDLQAGAGMSFKSMPEVSQQLLASFVVYGDRM